MCEILRREVYLGKIVIPANEEEPQRMIEGVHEPLVSESLFYSVQSLLDENKKYSRAIGSKLIGFGRGLFTLKC